MRKRETKKFTPKFPTKPFINSTANVPFYILMENVYNEYQLRRHCVEMGKILNCKFNCCKKKVEQAFEITRKTNANPT